MKRFFASGQRVLFYGDSVTGGAFPGKVRDLYRTLFPEETPEFSARGLYGGTSADLLEGYDAGVKAFAPDFLTLLAGVNDTWNVWLGGSPVPAARYRENLRRLLELVRGDFPRCRVLLMKPFLLDTDPEKRPWHADLDPKAEAAEELAREAADYFLDLPGLFARELAGGARPEELSPDGVHPTDFGHSLIAAELLRTVGVL